MPFPGGMITFHVIFPRKVSAGDWRKLVADEEPFGPLTIYEEVGIASISRWGKVLTFCAGGNNTVLDLEIDVSHFARPLLDAIDLAELHGMWG